MSSQFPIPDYDKGLLAPMLIKALVQEKNATFVTSP